MYCIFHEMRKNTAVKQDIVYLKKKKLIRIEFCTLKVYV